MKLEGTRVIMNDTAVRIEEDARRYEKKQNNRRTANQPQQGMNRTKTYPAQTKSPEKKLKERGRSGLRVFGDGLW